MYTRTYTYIYKYNTRLFDRRKIMVYLRSNKIMCMYILYI